MFGRGIICFHVELVPIFFAISNHLIFYTKSVEAVYSKPINSNDVENKKSTSEGSSRFPSSSKQRLCCHDLEQLTTLWKKSQWKSLFSLWPLLWTYIFLFWSEVLSVAGVNFFSYFGELMLLLLFWDKQPLSWALQPLFCLAAICPLRWCQRADPGCIGSSPGLILKVPRWAQRHAKPGRINILRRVCVWLQCSPLVWCLQVVTILLGLFQVLLSALLVYTDGTLPRLFILPLLLGILVCPIWFSASITKAFSQWTQMSLIPSVCVCVCVGRLWQEDPSP